MRRQPTIVRCFVILCLGSSVALAALAWRNPFPEPVVLTLESAPDLNADEALSAQQAQVTAKSQPGFWSFAQLWTGSTQADAADESPVELVLSLESRTLEVKVVGEPLMTYDVAVGQADWETPTGEFIVLNKLENPAWQHPITKEEIVPGPENPLGSHWIGFWTDGRSQIGFHGTNQEHLIGEAVSHGCVRMRNEDVAALYQLVEAGTPVIVQP